MASSTTTRPTVPKEPVHYKTFEQNFVNDKTKQQTKDKIMVITGVSTSDSIGYGVLRMMVSLETRCIVLTRNVEKAEKNIVSKLKEDVKNLENPEKYIKFYPCDLSKFASVRSCGENIAKDLKAFPEFDIETKKITFLVNNAGIAGHELRMTEDNNECQIQFNHLSHFLLQSYLQPFLNASERHIR